MTMVKKALWVVLIIISGVTSTLKSVSATNEIIRVFDHSQIATLLNHGKKLCITCPTIRFSEFGVLSLHPMQIHVGSQDVTAENFRAVGRFIQYHPSYKIKYCFDDLDKNSNHVSIHRQIIQRDIGHSAQINTIEGSDHVIVCDDGTSWCASRFDLSCFALRGVHPKMEKNTGFQALNATQKEPISSIDILLNNTEVFIPRFFYDSSRLNISCFPVDYSEDRPQIILTAHPGHTFRIARIVDEDSMDTEGTEQ